MHGEKPMFEIAERVQEYMPAQTTGCFLGPDIKKALFDFLVSAVNLVQDVNNRLSS